MFSLPSARPPGHRLDRPFADEVHADLVDVAFVEAVAEGLRPGHSCHDEWVRCWRTHWLTASRLAISYLRSTDAGEHAQLCADITNRIVTAMLVHQEWAERFIRLAIAEELTLRGWPLEVALDLAGVAPDGRSRIVAGVAGVTPDGRVGVACHGTAYEGTAARLAYLHGALAGADLP